MPTIQQRPSRSQGLGNGAAIVDFNPDNIIAKRAPVNGSDFAEPGTNWTYLGVGTYTYVGAPTYWVTSPSAGVGSFTSLDVNPGNAVIDAGNLTLTLGNLVLSAGNATIAG